jgi:hypothetical protein
MKIKATILASLIILLGNSAASDSPARPVLIGIFAKKYDATVSWYGANFGFKTVTEVVNNAANLRIGFLDNGAFELEVYSNIDPALNEDRLRRDRFGMPSEGFVKLSLMTKDLSQLATALSVNGVEFVREINESGRFWPRTTAYR